MIAQVPLPPIPQPPHDPTSLLLNGRVGWCIASKSEIDERDGALVLTLLPASQRSLAEPSGSFGGATLPRNVALGTDGSIYLLDRSTAQLKRFNQCDCVFEVVPCFGGQGAAARELKDPNGIAICSGDLFVCDTGNHRVTVLALKGLVLRTHWKPPAHAYHGPQAQLTNKWEPSAIAFDSDGRAYITDSANGCVHRFGANGHWDLWLSGMGVMTAIAVDCEDQVNVLVETLSSEVHLFSTAGLSLGITNSIDRLRSRMPCPGFVVDRDGNLHLGPMCQDESPTESDCGCEDGKSKKSEKGVFDLNGNALPNFPPASPLLFSPSGTLFTEALDSELYRCQWHRLVLDARIPTGSRVMVSTFTSEALQTAVQIQSLSDEAWETRVLARNVTTRAWDCLIRSGGGRYLWLKLELFSNGVASPLINGIEIEFPRISLRRYLPGVFGSEAVSTDLTDRFLSLFDTTLRSIETTIDHLARYFDPLSTPSDRDPTTGVDFLTWLASWIGISLDRHWPEAKRRQLLKNAGRLFQLRGTRIGLWRQLVLLLEFDPADCCCPDDKPRKTCAPRQLNCAPEEKLPCAWEPPPLILEHYKLRRWLFVGSGILGEQAVLWGKKIINRSQLDETAQTDVTQLIAKPDPLRDPFHLYAHKFSVFVPGCYRRSDRSRKALENLLQSERPAHTRSQIEYVEPMFRIGIQSMVGFDSVIGRYPSGVALGDMQLGSGTVISGPPHESGGPSMKLDKTGSGARIGNTSVLD